MLGGLGNIAGMLKQVKSIQSRLVEVQAQLADRRFESESGGGMVKATVDGRGLLVDIRIDPQAVGDVELLEDLIRAAVGAAGQRAQESAQAEMAELTGGLNIPGLSDLLGGTAGRP